MSHRFAAMLVLSCSSFACSSTGVGNPGVASLSLSSDSEVEPDATDGSEQLESAALRHAVVVFGEIKYLACDTNEADEAVKGPFVVDLVQDGAATMIPPVVVPPHGFCGIDATLAPATAPAAMAGRSLFFSGLRADGTLFLLFADIAGTLRMRPLPSVSWQTQAEAGHTWLWKLRPRRWLLPTELDAEDATELDGGSRVIAIDVNRHPALYAAIRARLARRSTLHSDTNDNGRLDPEERVGESFIGQGLDTID